MGKLSIEHEMNTQQYEQQMVRKDLKNKALQTNILGKEEQLK